MRYLFIAVAASLLTTSALAADLAPAPAEPVAPAAAPFSWTGFYAGVNAGASITNDGKMFDLTGWNAIGDYNKIDSKTSFTGGAQFGYNWQINQFVVGAEGDINYLNYRSSGPAIVAATGAISSGGDTIGSKKANILSTLRARLGYAVFNNALLVYATGGVAFSDLKYSMKDLCNTGACGGGLLAGTTHQNVGFAVGAGLEYALTQNWTIRGEYIYSQFAGKTIDGTNLGSGGRFKFSAPKTEFNTLRLAVNYKF